MDGPEEVAMDKGADASGFVPETEIGGSEVVLDNPGGLGDAPGPALNLGVLAFEGSPGGGAFHGVGVEREVERGDFDFALVFKESFEEDAPVFGDFVGVPVVGLMEKLETERIILLIDEAVFSGKHGENENASEGVGDASDSGEAPDVIVEEDGRLPEAAIAVWVIEEFVGEDGIVLGVKDVVGVATGDGGIVHFDDAFVDEVFLGPDGGVALVAGFADGFAGGELVDGEVEMFETTAEALGESAADLITVGFGSLVFLGNDDDELILGESLIF